MTIQSLWADKNFPKINALTSYALSSAKLTIFFDPSRARSSVDLLFHEGLHGYSSAMNSGRGSSSFTDRGLMTLFGIQTNNSEDIEKYIDEHCGKYFANL